MTDDEQTLAFYDREAPVYAPWSIPDGRFPWLEKFLSLVPAGARLLDYGCGGGWAARRMLEAGHQVDAFDGSAGLAEEARRLTGLDVRVMRFAEFAAEDRYDGIWASFCLLHAPRAEMAGNLERIARALRPGGALYLGLKAGTGESRDRLGRYYAYYTEEEIRDLLSAAGLADIHVSIRGGETGYEGDPATSMHVYARRP